MSLADFVKEHRGKMASSTSSSYFTRQSFSMANLGSKVSTSFNGFFRTDVSSASADDTECLTENPSQNGQLPSARNRRGLGWMGFTSSASPDGPASFVDSGGGVCGLSRLQRIAAFFLCVIAAAICFGGALMLLPILIVQTRKFAALNTLGSIFFIMSFGFLWGPLPYVQFLFSAQRRLVTVAYTLSVLTTLYTALWLQSTLLTILSSSFQTVALVWYLLSYVPGGERGLKFLTKVFSSLCTRKSSSLVLPM